MLVPTNKRYPKGRGNGGHKMLLHILVTIHKLFFIQGLSLRGRLDSSASIVVGYGEMELQRTVNV